MNVSTLLSQASQQLKDASIRSSHLDAEVLLAHILGTTRSWLAAHGDEIVSASITTTFLQLVQQRSNHEPVAYLVGTKEFYGRDFIVTPDVLIPRPETEDLIDLALKIGQHTPQKVVDVGCGSGCIGITLKLEQPAWDITLSDISTVALDVAKKNAARLSASVTISQSDVLSSYNTPFMYSVIVANLPYVDRSWETSPETMFEPQQALYAGQNGLAYIYKLITQSSAILQNGGHLLLEADPEQHDDIKLFAAKYGFTRLETRGYALSFVSQQ